MRLNKLRKFRPFQFSEKLMEMTRHIRTYKGDWSYLFFLTLIPLGQVFGFIIIIVTCVEDIKYRKKIYGKSPYFTLLVAFFTTFSTFYFYLFLLTTSRG